jgi:histidinol-phosphate aminotransferase
MITRLAKKTIFEIQPYVPGKPIEEVKRELGLKDVIKLASNENPYGPSPKARQAVIQASRHLHRYPDGDCYYLRRELAERLKVVPSQIVFGNGSDEIIVLAVRAFVNEGDEVIIAKPSFLIYEIASRLAGAGVRAVPLKNFYYDLDGMKGLRKDILIFIDEAYHEYVQAPDYVDSIKLLKTHHNVIVTRTFSKMYGLAGLRIGYGIADPALAQCLNRLREPFNVNTLAQTAALACLRDRAYYNGLARKISRQREVLYDGVAKLGLKYVESCTNFVLIDVRQKSSVIAKRLLKMGVIVRDMGFWGLDHFIRVTIGTESENKRFLETLKEIL